MYQTEPVKGGSHNHNSTKTFTLEAGTLAFVFSLFHSLTRYYALLALHGSATGHYDESWTTVPWLPPLPQFHNVPIQDTQHSVPMVHDLKY